MKKKECNITHLSTEYNEKYFTLYGCGKFQESSKTMNRIEASLLYVELHKFLTQEENPSVAAK